MSKIKRIVINNFRNIRHLEIDVKENGVTQITGDNNLGKSNTLNAVMWFLTDTLLTDKWGTGENDVNSIVPINQVKGEYVSVEITFTTGVVFEKRYKTSYDLKTGKVKGHTTGGLINGAESKNMSLWNDDLNKELGYTPYLNGFKEFNIFTDALYALQKMDSKDLRVLLQKLGCNVSNKEVFDALNLGTEISFMELEEVKYRGNFYDMRTDYKRKLSADKNSLETVNNQLGLFNGIEEADTTKLENIKKELEEVNKQYYSVSDSALENKINDKSNEVRELKIKREEELTKFRADNFNQKSKLISLINKEEEKLEKIKNEANRGDYAALESINKEIDIAAKTIQAYELSKNNIQRALEQCSQTGKAYVQDQRDTAAKLNALYEETYRDFITCPNCQHQFILDESKKNVWEFNRKRDIDSLNAKLDSLKVKIQDTLTSLNAFKMQLKETDENYNKALKDLEILNKKKEELQSNFKKKEIVLDTTELDKLNNQLKALEQASYDTSIIDSKIDTLNEELTKLRLERDSELDKMRFELQEQKNQLLEQQHQEELKVYDYQKKLELQAKQEELIKIYNEHEHQVSIINQFIHKSIEMCNEKAKAITGFDFVMLEETLSDTVKEVCYLTVDGVPFSNVNTSKKILIGVAFINRIKEVLTGYGIAKNDLPILADKLETVSNTTLGSNIELFNDVQFITTKVTEGKELTIL